MDLTRFSAGGALERTALGNRVTLATGGNLPARAMPNRVGRLPGSRMSG